MNKTKEERKTLKKLVPLTILMILGKKYLVLDFNLQLKNLGPYFLSAQLPKVRKTLFIKWYFQAR